MTVYSVNDIFPGGGFRQVNLQTQTGQRQLGSAIKAFFDRTAQTERTIRELKSQAIREFTITSNFPEDTRAKIEKMMVGLPEVDMAYEAAFRTVDLSNVPAPNFTLKNVKNLMTFKKVVEGEPAQIYSIAGTEATFGFDTYRAGIEIPKHWLDDHDWYNIAQVVGDGRLAWYRDRATIFYALIEGLQDAMVGTEAGVNVAHDETASTTVEKDIITINNACESLILGLELAGFGVTPQTTFTLLTHLTMAKRVRAALGLQTGPLYHGTTVPYNVNVVVTTKLNTAKTWIEAAPSTKAASHIPLGYLTIHGLNNLILEREPLNFTPVDFNPEYNTWRQYGGGRYSGCIYPAQWRRLLATT